MAAPTRQEIREHILIDGMPPDSRQLLDYENTSSNVYKEVDAEAGVLKAFGFDLVEQFRTETLASAATSATHGLLSDWEDALGIPPPTSATSDTDASRVASVVARLREFGASTKDNIKASLAVVTGSASAVTIIEHKRSVLRATNLRSFSPLTTNVGAVGGVLLSLADNAPASQMGLQLNYNISTGDQSEFQITLTAPDAQQKVWQSEIIVDGADHVLYWSEFAGSQIGGTWFLTVDNTLGGATTVQMDSASIFIEGIGRDVLSGAEGLGSNIFEWAALVNEGLTSTVTYNRSLVRMLVDHWNPAHARGYLALYATTGAAGAVFDDTNSLLDGCLFS